MALWFKYYLPV